MAKTIFYSLAVLPLKNKIHIFAPPCNILHIFYYAFACLFVCKQFHFLLIYTADNYTLESGNNQRSRCLVSVLLMTKKFVLTNNSVSFDYRVDSRDCRHGVLGCDGLGFFIDGQQVLQYQGNQFHWVTKTYNLKKVSLNQTLPADSVMLHKTELWQLGSK